MQLLKQYFLSNGYDISSKFRVFRALLTYRNAIRNFGAIFHYHDVVRVQIVNVPYLA